MSKLEQFNALLTELSQGANFGKREASMQLAADLAAWLGPHALVGGATEGDATMPQCGKIITCPPRFAKGRLTRGARVKGF